MNRYPLWVYVTIAVALVLGALYTLPNFFGEAPAVQVSAARATLKADTAVLGRVEDALKKAGIQPTGIFLDQAGVKVTTLDNVRACPFSTRSKSAVESSWRTTRSRDCTNSEHLVTSNDTATAGS